MGLDAFAYPSLVKTSVNNALPIAAYRQKIVDSVRANAVTIIVAETGSGKSTQVPQFLIAEGFTTIVTEPRRLAARSVAERVAEEWGSKIGEEVGYRIAGESCDSDKTRCLFCTDGLTLVRELVGMNRANVLVIDEVHEWNLNIEVLVAWVKHEIETGRDLKVVLMSATIESEKLSAYFGNAPIVTVPGRLFPVTVVEPSFSGCVDHAIDMARKGHNVLVFQPGKMEIQETIENLRNSGVHAEILALHGELDWLEQQKCFKHYGRPKIVVSTNVAQTSVTIDDIDVVIDSGLERRILTIDGVEGLYLKPISFKDSEQRKGRAGRTRHGTYVDYCPETNRPEYPIAEILRLRLDQIVLRLAEAGFDAEELEFFHQPDVNKIHEAKKVLKALGCISASGSVTPIGREVARLPISVRTGRMVVEAIRHGVVSDVVTIAAIIESGELHMRKDRDGFPVYSWRDIVKGERQSDLFAQLMLYRAAAKMRNNEMASNGILIKAFHRAKQIREHIAEALRGKINWSDSYDRELITRCIVSGLIDHVYVNQWQEFRNGDTCTRKLNRDSVVSPSSKIIVGMPRDIEFTGRFGKQTLNLVCMATEISLSLVYELAPHLVETKEGVVSYSDIHEGIITTTKICLNNQEVAERVEMTPDAPGTYEIIAQRMLSKFVVNSWEWPKNVRRLATDFTLHKTLPQVIEHPLGSHPVDGKVVLAYATLQMVGIIYACPQVVWTLSYAEALGKLQAFLERHHLENRVPAFKQPELTRNGLPDNPQPEAAKTKSPKPVDLSDLHGLAKHMGARVKK